MKHPDVEVPAKVPVSAVPHWEGSGWVRTDPPPKPARPVKVYATPVSATASQAVEAAAEHLAATTSAEPPADAPTSAKPKTKAPAGRKGED